MDILFGIVVTVFMGLFELYSSVIVSEEKTGKRIYLPWEKKDE
jgi:hypothetical protein